MNLPAHRRVSIVRLRSGARCAPGLAMLTYFTLSSGLPRIDGSSVGMGLALAQALDTARANGAPTPLASVGALATRNCIPRSIEPRQPTGGAALLDLLV
jgi:hypothetical protein